jgi:hypothetical protein
MTTPQRRRRRAIRLASAISGILFITITLVGPAIGGLVAP